MAHGIGSLGLKKIDDEDNVSPSTINENTETLNNLISGINNQLGSAIKTTNIDEYFMIKSFTWTDIAGKSGWQNFTQNIGVAGYMPLCVSTWAMGNGWGSSMIHFEMQNQMSNNHADHKLVYFINCNPNIMNFAASIVYIKKDNVG